MVCGTADILMKFLSLGWFGLGSCRRLHRRLHPKPKGGGPTQPASGLPYDPRLTL